MQLFRITATTKHALLENIARYIQAEEPQACDLDNTMPYCVSIIYNSTEDLKAQLLTKSETITMRESPSKVAWLYTGQGCQYLHMAEALLGDSRSRNFIKSACQYLKETHQLDILPLLIQVQDGIDHNSIHETVVSQPCIAVLQLALTKLLHTHGLTPDYCIGHSVGEFAAAYTAGYYDEWTCLDLIAQRAKSMQQAPTQGSMIACRMSAEQVNQLFEQEAQLIEIAGKNSPKQTVLSVTHSNLDRVREILTCAKIRYQTLNVSHAFHSTQMLSAAQVFGKLSAKTVAKKHPNTNTKLIRNTDAKIAPVEYGNKYWEQHILLPVLFQESLKVAFEQGCRTFVEIGPHPVLSRFVKDTLENHTNVIKLVHMLKKGINYEEMLKQLALFDERTQAVNWNMQLFSETVNS